MRDEACCEGWSYREILPYFKRAEGNERFVNDYHSQDGPLGIAVLRDRQINVALYNSPLFI